MGLSLGRFLESWVMRSLLFVAGMGFATFVLSQDGKVGEILLVKGEVFILDKNSKVIADPQGKRGRSTAAGQPFFVGETVQTKTGARVKLKFIEGGNEVVLGSDTSLLIERASTEGGKKGTTLNLAKGEVRSDVKTKYSGQGGDTYEVKTNNAVAGVRGTSFLTALNPKTGVLKVATLTGMVAVSGVDSKTGAVKAPVMVAPGMMTVSEPGKPVESPKPTATDPAMTSTVKALEGSGSGDSSSSDSGGDSAASGDSGSQEKSGSASEKPSESSTGSEKQSSSEKSQSESGKNETASSDNGKGESQKNSGGGESGSKTAAAGGSESSSNTQAGNSSGSSGDGGRQPASTSSGSSGSTQAAAGGGGEGGGAPLGRMTQSSGASSGGSAAGAAGGSVTPAPAAPVIMGSAPGGGMRSPASIGGSGTIVGMPNVGNVANTIANQVNRTINNNGPAPTIVQPPKVIIRIE
jgi:hypothetical protein